MLVCEVQTDALTIQRAGVVLGLSGVFRFTLSLDLIDPSQFSSRVRLVFVPRAGGAAPRFACWKPDT